MINKPIRDLAARVLATECGEEGITIHTAGRVCEKLGVLLSKLAGPAGYRSLLARALALAKAEEPALTSVKVLADGTLHGLVDASTGVEINALMKGGLMLVAQLLGLLHTFIGEPLTMQLIKEIWPDTRLNGDTPDNTNTP